MSNKVRLTINSLLDKWQGCISVADSPAIALLTIERHPEISASLAEHLVRSIIIDRALASGVLR